jgi:hypothetical protein
MTEFFTHKLKTNSGNLVGNLFDLWKLLIYSSPYFGTTLTIP